MPHRPASFVQALLWTTAQMADVLTLNLPARLVVRCKAEDLHDALGCHQSCLSQAAKRTNHLYPVSSQDKHIAWSFRSLCPRTRMSDWLAVLEVCFLGRKPHIRRRRWIEANGRAPEPAGKFLIGAKLTAWREDISLTGSWGRSNVPCDMTQWQETRVRFEASPAITHEHAN